VVVETALRAPDLLSALHAAAKLPIGLFRLERAIAAQLLGVESTRTSRPNFHIPEAFGTLAIE
jgi:hypothetical protein